MEVPDSPFRLEQDTGIERATESSDSFPERTHTDREPFHDIEPVQYQVFTRMVQTRFT